MKIRLTKHAKRRAAQRCISPNDLDLILLYGTEIPDRKGEAYLLRKKDVDTAIRSLKGRIQRLEKLTGCAAVLSGEDVITTYHATHQGEKRLLRRQA